MKEKKSLGRPRHRWDDINIDHKWIGYKGMGYTHVALDVVRGMLL
jgi:hypothetical protein